MLRAAGLFAGVAALILLAFVFMRDSGAPKALIAVVALTIGIGGVWGMFSAGDGVVDALPRRLRDAVRPWLFVGPAILIVGIYIVFPAVRTIWISFFDRTSREFVGLASYAFIITDADMLLVLRNTLLWVVLVPLFSVLIDRIGRVVERIVKALIFLAMAISFVGASVIWRFVSRHEARQAGHLDLPGSAGDHLDGPDAGAVGELVSAGGCGREQRLVDSLRQAVRVRTVDPAQLRTGDPGRQHGQRLPEQPAGGDPVHGDPDHDRRVRGLRDRVDGLPGAPSDPRSSSSAC